MSDRVYARVPAQQETLTKSTPGSYLLQHTPVRDGSISFPQESVPSPGSVMKSVPHVGHNLSQIPVYPPVTGTIQTKLVVSASGDEYEQEAEHVSELVMRMPRPQSHQVHTDGEAYPNYQMERPGHGNGRLQMKRVQVSDSGQVVASPIVNEVLRSPSQPLDSATRAFMEPRFGHDFNHVRVHTDERAGTSSQMLNARAYTVGHNIVFSTGQYAPMTTTGQRLLAHELMHVIQQQATGPRLARTPGDREDTTIGTEWEPVEVAEWKGVLEKQGYEVFSRNEFSQVKWLREAFTDARARPDLVGINRTTKKILVGDITAGSWSTTKLKPGDLQKLPHDIGGEAETKAHLEKTMDDARQLARKLPNDMKDFEVVARDRWWKQRGYSREVMVQKGLKPQSKPPSSKPEPRPSVPTSVRADMPEVAASEKTEPPTRINVETSKTEPPTSTTTEARKNEPTARVGMPDIEPIHEGGPSARGEALGGGVMLGAQLKDWIMGKLGDKAQAKRVQAVLNRRMGYIQSQQHDHPELGVLITSYWRLYRGNEGETSRRFEDISIKTGTTEREARESPEPSVLNLSASAADTETDERWIPPQKPLSGIKYHTPYPKIAIATFASGRATLRDVKWGGPWGGFEKKGTTTLNVSEGMHPTFAILRPPASIRVEGYNPVSIDTDSEITFDGYKVPVISNLHAALVFPLDGETAMLLSNGPGIHDTMYQLGGEFDLFRWVPIEDIQIESVLSSEVEQPKPTAEQEFFQSYVRFVTMHPQQTHPFATGNRRPQQPEADKNMLYFSRSGEVVTLDRLLVWAKQNHPRGLADPTMLKDLYGSHEFSGSDDARERAAIALTLKLREEQSKGHTIK